MKFTPLLTAASAFVASASAACAVTASGTININWNGDINLSGGTLYDSGRLFCNSDANGWYVDQDNHISIHCSPGFVYAFTKDGKQAWYGTSDGHAYAWSQGTSTSSSDCSGDPFSPQCQTISWYQGEFCS